MKILLVDDDPEYLEYAETAWRKERGDLEVNTFENPEEALKELEKDDYDVVVSDYKMPEVDGLKFLNGVKSRDESIAFVILTGRGGEDVAMQSVNRRADGYVKKDMDSEKQLEIIEDALYDRPVNR